MLCEEQVLQSARRRLSILQVTCRLHVLRKPADTLSVALAHDDRAHEDLDGADALEGDLALASCDTIQVSTTHSSYPETSNLKIWKAY